MFAFRLNNIHDMYCPFQTLCLMGVFMIVLLVGSCASMETSANRNGDQSLTVSKNAPLLPEDLERRKKTLVDNLRRHPQRLDSMSKDDVMLALNGLSLERREADNTNLQFVSSYCVMDVFYTNTRFKGLNGSTINTTNGAMDHMTNAPRPSYIDMRKVSLNKGNAEGYSAIDRDQCVRSFL